MRHLSLVLAGIFLLGLVNTNAQGSVGIGTSTPLAKLHVQADNSTVLLVENTAQLNINTNSRMLFKTGSFYTGIIGTYGTGLATSRLAFSTYANSNPANVLERMSILDNGNVGINTTTPAYKLDINGDTRTGGNLTITGEVNKPSTGASNMLPIAYGKIDADGDVLGGTGNFTVERSSTGKYFITLPSDPNVFSNQNQYIVLATPIWVGGTTTQVYFTPGNQIAIITSLPTNSAVEGYIYEDHSFSFLIYKL